MRFILHAHALSKKIVLITTAFVLSVSSLTAVAPFVLSERASAIGGVGYANVSPSAGWSVDRTAPSGGYGSQTFNGRQVLYMNVDAPSDAPSSFYQYEGISKAVSNGTQTVKADLYIDPSWPSNVRAGFWGVGHDASGDISSYPIVEYNTATSSTHWRIWDSANGGWRDVAAPSATTGWNTIELALNKTNSSKTDVYVNSVLIGASTTDPTVDLRRIILNNYNFGTDDYTVRWSNIQSGIYNPDAPTHLRFTKDSNAATVAAGSAVKDANITLRWDTVANAERYQVRVTDPTGASQADRNTGWYTFDLNDASRYGFFGTKQGAWTYQVRTKDATSGLWSEYSTPVTLKYDSVAPTAAVKANDIVLPENTSSSPVVYIPGAAATTFQATLTDSVSNPAGAYIELFRANWDGTYGNWVKDNTNGVGNVRYGASPKLVYDTSSLSGRYGLKIVSEDAAGNSKTTYHFFTIDSAYPGITFEAGTPADGTYVKGDVPVNVKVTDANIGAYHLSVAGHGTGTTGYVSLFYVNTPISGYTNPYTWSTKTGNKAVNDGAYQLSATTVDKAGNRSTITRSITVDNTKPVVTLANPGTAHFTSATTLNINATDTVALNKVVANIYKAGETSVYKPTQASVPGGATSYTHNVSLSTLTEGAYYIKFNATDLADNLASTITFNFVIDNTIPTATLIFPTAGPSATGFQVKFSEAVNEAEAKNAANYYLENWPNASGSGDLSGDAAVSYDTVTHVATVSFTNASWYVSPEQKWGVKNIHDLAGNSIVDTSAYSTNLVKPEITTTPTSSSAVNSLTQTWTWAGTDPTDATNASGVKGYEYAFVDSSTAPSTWTATSSTSATVTAPADGTYRLYVRALDNAGNIGDSVYGEVILDTTPPSATITTFTAELVTGTADPDADIVLVIDGVNSAPFTANPDGAWSFAITPALTTGSHAVAVLATDGANNVFTSPQRTLVVEAPSITLSSTNSPTPPTPQSRVLPSSNQGGAGVLGTTNNANNNPSGAADVKGTSTANTLADAVDANNNDGKALGLAWYWWLLIVAALAAIVWWIAGAIRNRQENE